MILDKLHEAVLSFRGNAYLQLVNRVRKLLKQVSAWQPQFSGSYNK